MRMHTDKEKFKNSHGGKVPWNKGLTKESDSRIKESSKSISIGIKRAYKEKRITGKGSTHIKEILRREKNI